MDRRTVRPTPTRDKHRRRPGSLIRRVRGLALATAAASILLFASAAPALAYEPVGIVHTEQVQAGPYHLTVGFSAWPVRAMQSLDITFVPTDGIAGKSGTLALNLPGSGMKAYGESPLVRHPRKMNVWGLDVTSLPEPGQASFTFDIDGPRGHGRGTLHHITVLEQPGPPLALSWTVCALPALGLVAFFIVAWRRNTPSRQVPSLVL